MLDLTFYLSASYLSRRGQVAGSIPYRVIFEFFSDNPPVRTMAVDSTHLLTDEYQEYLLGVKAAGA